MITASKIVVSNEGSPYNPQIESPEAIKVYQQQTDNQVNVNDDSGVKPVMQGSFMLARTVEETNDPCKSDRSSIKNIILDGGEND